MAAQRSRAKTATCDGDIAGLASVRTWLPCPTSHRSPPVLEPVRAGSLRHAGELGDRWEEGGTVLHTTGIGQHLGLISFRCICLTGPSKLQSAGLQLK